MKDVSRGAIVEEQLFLAAKVGQLEIVQHLIDLGDDVNWANNRGGETALIWASFNGFPPIAALLLQHGADVNKASTSGSANAPLYWAASHIFLQTVALFRKHVADVNKRNSYGETPPTVASHNALIAVISVLLENGADVNILDNQGYTPLSAAYGHKTNSKDAVKAIVQHYTDLYAQQYYSGTDPIPPIALSAIDSAIFRAVPHTAARPEVCTMAMCEFLGECSRL